MWRLALAGLAVAGHAVVAAWSLPVGAVAALLVATPWLLAMVRRPDRTLATLLARATSPEFVV